MKKSIKERGIYYTFYLLQSLYEMYEIKPTYLCTIYTKILWTPMKM